MRRFLRIIAISLSLINYLVPISTQAASDAEIKTSSAIDFNHIFQHWVNSSQEEIPGSTVTIFRPENYKAFGPRFFRMRFEFTRDGSCKWLFLAPNDAHRFKSAQWRVDNVNVLHITTEGRNLGPIKS